MFSRPVSSSSFSFSSSSSIVVSSRSRVWPLLQASLLRARASCKPTEIAWVLLASESQACLRHDPGKSMGKISQGPRGGKGCDPGSRRALKTSIFLREPVLSYCGGGGIMTRSSSVGEFSGMSAACALQKHSWRRRGGRRQSAGSRATPGPPDPRVCEYTSAPLARLRVCAGEYHAARRSGHHSTRWRDAVSPPKTPLNCRVHYALLLKLLCAWFMWP